jgi:hypothetical protein
VKSAITITFESKTFRSVKVIVHGNGSLEDIENFDA